MSGRVKKNTTDWTPRYSPAHLRVILTSNFPTCERFSLSTDFSD